MAVTEKTVDFGQATLAAVQTRLRELRLGGWLLYDFRGTNPIATGVLGLPALSRRFFVLIPAEGAPVALTHRIEQQPWRGWIGENRPYLSWQSLDEELARLLSGRGTVAVERSPGGAVPYLDRVPAGVLEMIRRTGVEAVDSGELVSAFYSRWTEAGLKSHQRAARILRKTAHDAFDRIGAQLHAGEAPTEWSIREWIVATLRERGLEVGADTVVAVGANAANPHYAPSAGDHAPVRDGDVLLVDLWGKESRDAIYADQTWMAYVGGPVPERVQDLWLAIRDARDTAIDLIRTRFGHRESVAGWEVDDAARAVVRERGFADAFIHRTGHSIDRELHGSGPNIDNLETRDTRALVEGIGFSIEPGVYLTGEVGLRTEVNIYMSPAGPVVTTPEPQTEIHRIVIG